MPALNSYAFNALVNLAMGARAAFLEAGSRPESEIERYAGVLRAQDEARNSDGVTQGDSASIAAHAKPITVDEAFACTAANPELLAQLTDSYITFLYDHKGPPFNGAFDRAKVMQGSSDMIHYGVIFAALGSVPDPKSGFSQGYNPAAYLAG